MKAIIYLRTSTEEQNPQNQLKDCLSINKYGDHELFEEKQSAYKDRDRKEFNQVIKLIKQQENSHLIVWDLDRIYRNRKKLIEFFDMCKIYNCKIHSFRQTWLEELHKIQEPFNEIMHTLMLQIMGWLAEEESKKKSERVKLAVRKKEGHSTKSYKGNKWGRKSLSSQKQNKIKELRTQGKSIRDISKELNISVGVVHKFIPSIST